MYSNLYLGRDIKHDMVQLTATLSVRNVIPRYPVVIESVRYYDSHGRLVRDHLERPAELAALASVEFNREGSGHGGRAGCELSRQVVRARSRGRAVDRSCHGGTECQRRDFVHQRWRVITNEPQ
jgi:hypothetical protein